MQNEQAALPLTVREYIRLGRAVYRHTFEGFTYQDEGLVDEAIELMNLAARYCDQLALIHHGTVVEIGTPDQVLRPDVINNVYHMQLLRVDTDGVMQLLLLPND